MTSTATAPAVIATRTEVGPRSGATYNYALLSNGVELLNGQPTGQREARATWTRRGWLA